MAANAQTNMFRVYCDQLNQGVAPNDEVHALQVQYPSKFMTLCTVQLSHLIEISADYLESDGCDNTPLKKKLKGIFATSKVTAAPVVPVSEDILGKLKPLLDFLHKESSLQVEGIFRKSGHSSRQRELKRTLMSGTPLDLTEGKYNVHDVASVVKSFLTDLQEPLFTTKLLPLFSKVAWLSVPNTNDDGIQVPFDEVSWLIVRAKQLKALRILIYLLPDTNKTLFKQLLGLLNKAAEKEENRMSVDSLGTLFGPLLLSQPEASSKELQKTYPILNQLATLMIEKSEDLFLIPKSLAEDVSRNLRKEPVSRKPAAQCRSQTTPGKRPTRRQKSEHDNSDEDECIDTCIAFAERRVPVITPLSTPQASPCTPRPLGSPEVIDRDYEVARAYAQIQALPDSSLKRRLVQRAKDTKNGGLVEQPSPFVRSISNARGIRSSVRKALVMRSQSDMLAPSAHCEKPLTFLRDRLICTPLSCLKDSQDTSPTSPDTLPSDSSSDPDHMYSQTARCSPFKRKRRSRSQGRTPSGRPRLTSYQQVQSPKYSESTDSNQSIENQILLPVSTTTNPKLDCCDLLISEVLS